MTVHLITNTFLDTLTERFFIFMRSTNGEFRYLTKPAIYTFYFGFKTDDNNFISRILNKITNIANNTEANVKNLTFRGYDNIYKSTVYNVSQFNKLRYIISSNENKSGIFQCLAQNTFEDMNKHHYNIYGKKFVNLEKGEIYDTKERFIYTPLIAAYDLEMTSLNGLDPNLNVYLKSFVCGDSYYAIYTKGFYPGHIGEVQMQLVPDEPAVYVKCIMVESMYDIPNQLAELIYKHRPDVLTGYNIFNADNQLIYHLLAKKLSSWTPDRATGIMPYFSRTKKMDKNYVDSPSGYCMVVPGLEVQDMYSYLDSTLPSEKKIDMTLKHIGMEYVNDTKDDLDIRKLSNNYNSHNMEDKLSSIKYCVKDSLLTIKLYKHFNVWNYYIKLEEISGVGQQRALCTSNLTVCTGVFIAESKTLDYLLDDSIYEIYKPGGGQVIETIPGAYNYVVCVDASSLYPSIVIQYNLCPTTIVRDYSKLPTSYNTLTDGRGNTVLIDTSREGIIPCILRKALKKREEVRDSWRKLAKEKVPDNRLIEVLKGEEQAWKLIANSTCGALAEPSANNPLSCCILNDIITNTGRQLLNFSISFITNKYNNISVIYGDTDSIFIVGKYCHLDDKEAVMSMLNDLNSNIPEKINFKYEYTAVTFLLGTKKHYIYRDMLDSKTVIKGYKAVKSSSCTFGSKLFHEAIDILQDYNSDICEWYVNRKISECKNNPVMKDLCIKFSYRGKDYSEKSSAYKKISNFKKRGISFIPGEKVSILIMEPLYNNNLQECEKDKDLISSRTYLVDEVNEKDAHCIDILHTLSITCLNDLNKILILFPPSDASYKQTLNYQLDTIFQHETNININNLIKVLSDIDY